MLIGRCCVSLTYSAYFWACGGVLSLHLGITMISWHLGRPEGLNRHGCICLEPPKPPCQLYTPQVGGEDGTIWTEVSHLATTYPPWHPIGWGGSRNILLFPWSLKIFFDPKCADSQSVKSAAAKTGNSSSQTELKGFELNESWSWRRMIQKQSGNWKRSSFILLEGLQRISK